MSTNRIINGILFLLGNLFFLIGYSFITNKGMSIMTGVVAFAGVTFAICRTREIKNNHKKLIIAAYGVAFLLFLLF